MPNVRADIVAISTSTAVGTNTRPNAADFIGVLDGTSPETIGGLNVNFNGVVPAGAAFQVGDVVGRDINDSGGTRTFSYSLLLPADAVVGTGLENIEFDIDAFENDNANLEAADQLNWSMFLNGNATVVVSGGTSGDFETFDSTLVNPSAVLVNEVTVVLTVSGFNGGGEWFAAGGTLNATYNAIPEPGLPGVTVWLIIFVSCGRRRRD